MIAGLPLSFRTNIDVERLEFGNNGQVARVYGVDRKTDERVVWRLEKCVDKSGAVSDTKVPYNAKTGKHARANAGPPGPPDLVSEPAHYSWSRSHFNHREDLLPIHSNNHDACGGLTSRECSACTAKSASRFQFAFLVPPIRGVPRS